MFQFYVSASNYTRKFHSYFGISEYSTLLLITVGMCATVQISQIFSFSDRRIFTTSLHDFNLQFIQLLCLLPSYLTFEKRHNQNQTNNTDRTTMNFLLMLASLMVLLVSVASDATYPILGMSRTFYPSDEYNVTFSLDASWPKSPPLTEQIM